MRNQEFLEELNRNSVLKITRRYKSSSWEVQKFLMGGTFSTKVPTGRYFFTIVPPRRYFFPIWFLSHCLIDAVSCFSWAKVSRLQVSLMRYLWEETMGLVVRSLCHGRAEAGVDRGPNAPPSKILLEDWCQVGKEGVDFLS